MHSKTFCLGLGKCTNFFYLNIRYLLERDHFSLALFFAKRLAIMSESNPLNACSDVERKIASSYKVSDVTPFLHGNNEGLNKP